jgi:uncharacterized protein (TIGR00251 family)
MPEDGSGWSSVVITDRDGAVRLDVHARPRAPRTKVLGVKDGALAVALAAPPVDGEANLELARALAAVFGVPARDVEVVAGRTGKRKIVEIRGIDAKTARERLGAAEAASVNARRG